MTLPVASIFTDIPEAIIVFFHDTIGLGWGPAIIALVWANSPYADAYHRLWHTPLSIALGQYRLSLDLAHWVNDGLMTLFFLVIGLEVRREFDRGELRERRRAALPLIAGLGGMVLPAVLFLTLNPSGEAARGWAMVMATDTAFALGVLALAGRRCPVRLRIFLLTLVVVDDVGAISVIALAYSSSVVPGWLLLAGVALVTMWLLRRRGVESSSRLPAPLGGRADTVLAERTPSPAPPLRAQGRPLPRLRWHLQCPDLLPARRRP